MREIVLDTETTGLDAELGDRIVEIGAVELLNYMPTGRTFHQYINPERPMSAEAFNVHGLGDEFLKEKPKFEQVAPEFLAFIGDATLVIHNATFDMKFINAELKLIGQPEIDMARATDTLAIARKRFPGSPASLDALCRRFKIDTSGRVLHGALLDSQILAEVYLELIGGRQPGLALSPGSSTSLPMEESGVWRPHKRNQALPERISAEERQAHAAFVEALGPDCLWKRYR